MMRCETHRALLHQQLDGVEIGEEERAQMQAHEEECAACRAEGKALRAIHAQCVKLSDDVTVPEAFSRDWRRAVRREAAARRRRVSPRMLASAAAVLLIAVLGGTTLMENHADGAQQSEALMVRSRSGADTGTAYGATAEEMAMADETGTAAVSGEKRIRTAHVSLRTGAFDQAVEMLRTLSGQYGGYVSDEELYGVAGEEARSASMSVRVDASRLDAFLEQAGTLGEVRSRSVSTQDVTDAYTDVSGRLETARARRTRLNELIEQAQDMSELIELEAALSEVQESIEECERTLSGWDERVQYATVYVSVQETMDAQAAREGELGLGARLLGALEDSVEGMIGLAQDALVLFVKALPWLAAAAVLALTVFLIRKRHATPKK